MIQNVCTIVLSLLLFCNIAYSQGATTGSLEGRVKDQASGPMAGATVVAVHLPSGTRYGTVTRGDGTYSFSGMRVGGPYRVAVTFLGYEKAVSGELTITLGNTSRQDFAMSEQATELAPGVVSASGRGGSSIINNKEISYLPTISRLISDFTRLIPQSRGTFFTGQDSRLNALTVDGSTFSNSFGIAGMPGERTGVAPISIEALEQVGVSIASYDVRQSNFTGAAINMVTKSGGNDFRSSVYYHFRNEAFVGNKAASATFNPGTFQFNMVGVNFSGPIIKDKLFFFAGLEMEEYIRPATLFLANDGTQNAGGNITRVLKSDLDGLSSFLRDNFGYETGAYDGYDFTTSALRFIAKIDYSPNDRNKFTLRYNHLNSGSDQFIANSDAIGYGYRRGSISSLNFQNSNYSLVENIRSVIGEWNSILSEKLVNNLIAGYRHHDESRKNPAKLFPMVDILKDGVTYTTFGTEPFSPFNGLTYGTFQFQDNLSLFLKGHSLLAGFNLEKFSSSDSFFPGAQSVYVYNSLADFYADANGYLANPDRTTSTVNLKRFQYQYSNIPGMEMPVQQLKVVYAGLYLQDKWDITPNLKMTVGLRMDVPFFGDTGFRNPEVEQLSFRDENGKEVKYATDKLPDAKPLFSPRIGIEWDILGDDSFMLRGGSGIFTGQPPYVLISNQIGNNGILTGFEWLDGSAATPLYSRPFNPVTDTYKPANVSGNPAYRYALALTDPDFRFPQILRSNIAVTKQLPWNIEGNIEIIFDKDINGITNINANLPAANGNYSGADNRPRWTSGNRLNSKISNAIVLKNQSKGYSWNIAAAFEKRIRDIFYGKVGYSYGQTWNLMDVGTVAYSTWSFNPHSGNPNNPQPGLSQYSPGHRYFAAFSLKINSFNFGSTMLSLFFDSYSGGRQSYIFAGDVNGDGANSNDLIYVPKDRSEMSFQEYASGGKTFTVLQQEVAWDNYINQDKSLRRCRGKYAQRNGVALPMITRLDMSVSQQIKTRLFGRENGFTVRLDILNLTNLLNRNWGVAKTLITTQPLVFSGAVTSGGGVKPAYTLRAINGELLKSSFITTATINDVFRMQLALRWDL